MNNVFYPGEHIARYFRSLLIVADISGSVATYRAELRNVLLSKSAVRFDVALISKADNMVVWMESVESSGNQIFSIRTKHVFAVVEFTESGKLEESVIRLLPSCLILQDIEHGREVVTLTAKYPYSLTLNGDLVQLSLAPPDATAESILLEFPDAIRTINGMPPVEGSLVIKGVGDVSVIVNTADAADEELQNG